MANAEKVAAVAELTDRFKDSSGAVLTEYRGLTVAQLAELRRSLGDNATFAVIKNTLTKIAVTQAGLSDELAPMLVGPSAIAFVDGDVVEAAKGLRDFARANPFLVIKGGVLDGKALTPAEITKLADVEPREVLLAKLAGAMTATTARAAGAFAALPVQMAQLAEALRAKTEAEGGSPEPAADSAQSSTAEGSTAESGSAESGSAESGRAETSSPAEGGPDDSSPDESGSDESGPAEG
jgi:large subunit ribosomal protein L10